MKNNIDTTVKENAGQKCKKSRKMLFILLGIFIVMIILACVVWFVIKEKEAEERANGQQIEPTALLNFPWNSSYEEVKLWLSENEYEYTDAGFKLEFNIQANNLWEGVVWTCSYENAPDSLGINTGSWTTDIDKKNAYTVFMNCEEELINSFGNPLADYSNSHSLLFEGNNIMIRLIYWDDPGYVEMNVETKDSWVNSPRLS